MDKFSALIPKEQERLFLQMHMLPRQEASKKQRPKKRKGNKMGLDIFPSHRSNDGHHKETETEVKSPIPNCDGASLHSANATPDNNHQSRTWMSQNNIRATSIHQLLVSVGFSVVAWVDGLENGGWKRKER